MPLGSVAGHVSGAPQFGVTTVHEPEAHVATTRHWTRGSFPYEHASPVGAQLAPAVGALGGQPPALVPMSVALDAASCPASLALAPTSVPASIAVDAASPPVSLALNASFAPNASFALNASIAPPPSSLWLTVLLHPTLQEMEPRARRKRVALRMARD